MIKIHKELVLAAKERSTCQKRAVVCLLYDMNDYICAIGWNQCAPPTGVCSRLGVVQDKATYATESTCNWTHAEIGAINDWKTGKMEAKPIRAVLFGHDFFCQPCEDALKELGVLKFEVNPNFPSI